MGGVQGRCLPGAARRKFRLSLFLLFSLPYLGSPPSPSLSLSSALLCLLSLSRCAAASFWEFFGDRTIRGGRRSSVNSLNLRRMQIRARAITLSRPGLPEK